MDEHVQGSRPGRDVTRLAVPAVGAVVGVDGVVVLLDAAGEPVIEVSEFFAPPWLFPGRQPGTHRDGPTFTSVLAAHGFDVRPSRAAALMVLAEQLPAAVLGPLLGLHPHTAAHWTNLVKRDWTDYIAARAEPTF